MKSPKISCWVKTLTWTMLCELGHFSLSKVSRWLWFCDLVIFNYRTCLALLLNLGLSHFSLSNSSLVEVDVEMCSIANILSLRQKRSAKLTYIVEKDATEKMRRFSAKSPRGFIGALSFTIKSPFLQILSTESTESKIKTMPEILAPRSFKWYMVCSCAMLSSWENPIQTSTLQSINILVIFRKKSKTLISQQLSWAGKFSPWFCDPLGPTHHLIPLTQNRYVEVVLWEMDQLLKASSYKCRSYVRNWKWINGIIARSAFVMNLLNGTVIIEIYYQLKKLMSREVNFKGLLLIWPFLQPWTFDYIILYITISNSK